MTSSLKAKLGGSGHEWAAAAAPAKQAEPANKAEPAKRAKTDASKARQASVCCTPHSACVVWFRLTSRSRAARAARRRRRPVPKPRNLLRFASFSSVIVSASRSCILLVSASFLQKKLSPEKIQQILADPPAPFKRSKFACLQHPNELSCGCECRHVQPALPERPIA